MRMRVRRDGRYRFAIAVRGHEIACDQPAEAGGEDSAPTPPELLAASLAGCVAFYVARYCEQAGIPADDLEVLCDWQVGGKPRRMERLEVAVRLPACPPERRKAIERVANSCLIHATLQHPPEIVVRLADAEEAA